MKKVYHICTSLNLFIVTFIQTLLKRLGCFYIYIVHVCNTCWHAPVHTKCLYTYTCTHIPRNILLYTYTCTHLCTHIYTHRFLEWDWILGDESLEHYSWETDSPSLNATQNCQMNTLWSHMMYNVIYHRPCNRPNKTNVTWWMGFLWYFYCCIVFQIYMTNSMNVWDKSNYLWLKELAMPWEHEDPPRYTGKHL